MATTTVLLREDIEHLGGRGEVVKVKAGFARNYLLPQGFATLATKANIKQIENERDALLKKAANEKSTAELQAGQMDNLSLTFERKAGDGGTLFGSVTSMDIAEALKAKGYEIDRRKITLKDAIKEIGDYTVSVKLHREVSLEIPVSVIAEGSDAKPAKKVEKATETVTEEVAEVEETVTEEVAEVEETEAETEEKES